MSESVFLNPQKGGRDIKGKIVDNDGEHYIVQTQTALGGTQKIKIHKSFMKEEQIDEALTIAQRQKRKMIALKLQPKLKRARNIAKRKRAPKEIIKKRSFKLAKKIIRRKIAGKMGADYANLSPSQKINIDKLTDAKKNAIKKLALRLIPRVQQLEAQRLQAFLKGKSMKNVNEEQLNEKFSLLLNDKQEDRLDTAQKTNNKYIKMYKRFKDHVKDDSAIRESLDKKAEKSGIDVVTLGEVFVRGLEAWKESYKYSKEQYAFARVNSYINQGKTYFAEDADLHDFENATELNEISQRILRNYASKRETQLKNSPQTSEKNKAYIDTRRKLHGDDDPAVQNWDSDAKKYEKKKAGYEKAVKKLGGFDQEKHVKSEYEKSEKVRKQWSGNTKHGQVMGHDPNKKDHVIVRQKVPQGIRSKNNDEYKDVSMHVSKLKEDILEWYLFDKFGKRIVDPKKPCKKGYEMVGHRNENGQDVPVCKKIGVAKEEAELEEGKMSAIHYDMNELDNGNFKKKYGKSKEEMHASMKPTVKESNLEEGRADSPAFKAAQKNLADLKQGGKDRAEKERLEKQHQKEAKAKKAKEHQEKAQKHYDRMNYHKEMHDDHESIRSDIDRGDWKNHGFESKEHARGAEEELAYQSEIHRRKYEDHKDDHEYHADEYKHHTGKDWKPAKKKYKKLSYSDFVAARNKRSVKEETLDENWNKGSSSSYHSDNIASIKHKKSRDIAWKDAKKHDEDSDEHKRLIAKGYMHDAKYIKHSYHAGKYGSMDQAKKDYKASMDKHKEYKSMISEMEVDSSKREVGTDSAVKNYTDDTPGQDLSWKKDKSTKHENCGTDACCNKCSTMKEDSEDRIPVHTTAADRKMIKVTTPSGKKVWKRAPRSKDIVK